MSDFNDIQHLLEKFWESETTLEEERQLKAYFASGVVDERLRKFAPMFQAFREEQTVQLNKAKVVPVRPMMYWAAAASIALLIIAGVWWMFSTPDTTTMAVKTTKTEQPAAQPDRLPTAENKTIAEAQPETAKHPVGQKRSKPIRKKTVEPDAEEIAAMEEIKAALALVSSKIRKGRNEAAKGAVHLESVDRLFKRKEG